MGGGRRRNVEEKPEVKRKLGESEMGGRKEANPLIERKDRKEGEMEGKKDMKDYKEKTMKRRKKQ